MRDYEMLESLKDMKTSSSDRVPLNPEEWEYQDFLLQVYP